MQSPVLVLSKSSFTALWIALNFSLRCVCVCLLFSNDNVFAYELPAPFYYPFCASDGFILHLRVIFYFVREILGFVRPAYTANQVIWSKIASFGCIRVCAFMCKFC